MKQLVDLSISLTANGNGAVRLSRELKENTLTVTAPNNTDAVRLRSNSEERVILRRPLLITRSISDEPKGE